MICVDWTWTHPNLSVNFLLIGKFPGSLSYLSYWRTPAVMTFQATTSSATASLSSFQASSSPLSLASLSGSLDPIPSEAWPRLEQPGSVSVAELEHESIPFKMEQPCPGCVAQLCLSLPIEPDLSQSILLGDRWLVLKKLQRCKYRAMWIAVGGIHRHLHSH